MKNIYISLAAVIISAISLTVSWLSYRRDRPDAKIIVFKTALIGGSKNDESYTSINITNTGRRQLTISTTGYRSLWNPNRSTIITAPSPLPKKLTEGDAIVCLFKKSDVLEDGSWKKVAYVFASDSAGREYRCRIAPFYKVWGFELLGKIVNPFHHITSHFKHKNND